VFLSSVGDILENKYVEVAEVSPFKPRHASGREQKWANLRQTSSNLGFSTAEDSNCSVQLVSTQTRRVIPHDTPHHSSYTRDLLMHKFTDAPLPTRPSTSLGRSSSVSSSMQVIAAAAILGIAHCSPLHRRTLPLQRLAPTSDLQSLHRLRWSRSSSGAPASAKITRPRTRWQTFSRNSCRCLLQRHAL
jgi:hypothetical protein